MRSRYGRTIAVVIALVASVTLRPQAQTPAPAGAAPFDIIGFIDAATVTPEADGFSGGGTVTVNGTTIIVPKNTLLQMPAFALTWQELFAMAPDTWKATGASGLATADRDADGNAPATTYEIHVQGNRITSGGEEQYIAGLVFVAQQSLNNGAGLINYIDYATGELRVGGTIGDATTGARVIINDPAGKFGRATAFDQRFTIDEDNPTVRSETSFPMCVPRLDPATGSDPLCPQSNRPKGADGNFLTTFTTDVPLGWEFLTPPNYAPNGSSALVMAPFEVGDYITYNGHLSTDANGDFVLAHGVIANVGIFTQPGTQPTYVAIDVMILGVAGAPVPFLPQEATVRTRIEGFTTDPSSFVMLSALDVDPCNGQITERFYDMVQVDPGPAPVGAAAAPGRGIGAVAGRWRWRPNSEGAFLPPTRMLKATTINGQYFDWNTGDSRTPAGIEAGIYAAPNFEFLFAENLGIGNPPVPSNFQEFPFLAHGSGAYYGAVPKLDESGNPVVDEFGNPIPLGRLGQLDPWPGATKPTTPVCSSDPNAPAVFTPVADAGPSLSVTRGTTITLDGSGSRDTTTPFPMPLTYTWWQTDATGNTLAASDTLHRVALPAGTPPFGTTQDLPRMTFKVDKLMNGRNIPDGTALTFRLDVSNCSPWSDPGSCGTSSALTTVTIAKNPTPTDTLTAVVAIWRAKRARLDVNATTSDPASVLEVAGFGVMGPALPIATGVPAPAGDRSYTQVGVNPAPTEITVRSSLGASVTVPVTVRP